MASETNRRVVVDPLAGCIERRLQLEALDFNRIPKTVSGRMPNEARREKHPKKRKAASVVSAPPADVPAEVLRFRDFVRRLITN